MTTTDLESALVLVRQETDLSAKSLLLAAVVSERFRERGFEPGKEQWLSYSSHMTASKLKTSQDRTWTWEQWQAGRAERRRLGNLVAPAVIRRDKSEGDGYLRETYGGERGPPFNKPFDPSADEKR